MTKQELQLLTQQLVTLGEDQGELEYWLDIYEDLEPDQQTELVTDLQEELKELQAIK